MKFKQIRVDIPLCVLIIVGIMIIPITSLSQEQRSVNVTAPDDEMRSSIHSVDGYAYLSDNLTLTDIRAAAFAEAKQKALEMAKTYAAPGNEAGAEFYEASWKIETGEK